MEKRKKELEDLIKQYKKVRLNTIDKDISEQTIRSWIQDFLTIFGWDTKDTSSIVQEKQLSKKEKEKLKEIKSTSNRPDYKLMVMGKPKTFLDTKNIDVDIKNSKDAAFQIKSYGWSISAPCAFITNFDEFAIYDTTYIPSFDQDANLGRIYLTIDEYIEKFELLDQHLNKDNIVNGVLERLYAENSIYRQHAEKISTDIAFADKLSKCRLILGNAIMIHNKHIINENVELLSYIVQIIINRIIFIRVCEARNVEREELLLEFENNGFWDSFKHSSYYDFFEHYDGPLFYRDQRLDNLKIPDDTFDSLLQLLYYPSPYKFDVIPTTLFSNIYEIFLAKRLELTEEGLVEVLKPEYAKSNGVVSTPQYLVHDLIKRTIIKSELLDYDFEKIFDIKILDFACGSGSFIVELFDYLQHIVIEKYIKTKEAKYSQYFYTKNKQVTMTIEGKRKLISDCIHGIDIDAEAVEVARMSLALKIIDDLLDYEDYSNIGIYGYQILNKIGENIEYGNTLVSSDIFQIVPEIAEEENTEQLNAMGIFNWGEDGFEEVFEKKGGFDYIIGNPPYVEAKHMTEHVPLMRKYLKQKYSSAKKGKIDLLIPFIERGLQLLMNKDGRLGVIVQNRFFKNEYGEELRKLISSNHYLSEVITFSANDIFKDRITYISSLVMDKEGTDKIYYQTLQEDKFVLPRSLDYLSTSTHDKKLFNVIDSTTIGKEPWIFEDADLLSIYNDLRKNNVQFGEFAKIRVGIQVLWVKAYHIKVLDIDEEKGILKGKNPLDNDIKIEIDACCPLVPNEKFYSFRKDVNSTFAIFPYEVIDGEKYQILFGEFCKRFPLAGAYLLKHKEVIQKNIKDSKYKRDDEERWHLYTRENNIEKAYSKVLIPMTANDVFASVTMNSKYYCDNSNVNYIDLPEKSETNLYATAAIFNSTIFSVMARAMANKQQNGYFKLNKQFLEPVLFPANIFEDHQGLVEELAKLGKSIEREQSAYRFEVPHKQKRIKTTLAKLWGELDSRVYQAYGLTNLQKMYFKDHGRNIDRVQILDNIL